MTRAGKTQISAVQSNMKLRNHQLNTQGQDNDEEQGLQGWHIWIQRIWFAYGQIEQHSGCLGGTVGGVESKVVVYRESYDLMTQGQHLNDFFDL